MIRLSKEVWLNIDKNGVITKKEEDFDNKLEKPNVILEEMAPEFNSGCG